MFGLPPGAGSSIAIAPKRIAATTDGFILQLSTLPLILNQTEHGNLPQVTWFAFSGAGSSIIVTEVILRDWPQ